MGVACDLVSCCELGPQALGWLAPVDLVFVVVVRVALPTRAGVCMRVCVCTSQVAATNATMELVQYGALLKPLMDTMQEAAEVLQRRDARRVEKQAAESFTKSEIPKVRQEAEEESKVDTGPSEAEKAAARKAVLQQAAAAKKATVVGFDVSDVESGVVVEAAPMSPVRRKPSITSEKPWYVDVFRVPCFVV